MKSFKEFVTEEGMRLIHTVQNDRKTAKVYRDAEWGEFRVKHFTDGQHHKDADYHTDDKEDAKNTAGLWIKPHNETT